MVQGPSATYIFAQCQCVSKKARLPWGLRGLPPTKFEYSACIFLKSSINVCRLNLYFAMESTPSPTALDPSARAHVRRLVLDVTCCAGLGCRVAASRVSWAKGAFGSQANTMLTVMVANLLNGTATSASRMHFVPFTQDRVSPQRFVDSKRCRVHGQGSTSVACLFVPVESLCKSSSSNVDEGPNAPWTSSTAAMQAAAASQLRLVHPYLIATEAAQLLFTPNEWLAQRCAALAQALGAETRAGLGLHVRRGDKLSAHGHEAISLPPASSIALQVARQAWRHRLESVLLLSDDPQLAHDLAALLPHLRVTALELPAMTAATSRSGRHRVVTGISPSRRAAPVDPNLVRNEIVTTSEMPSDVPTPITTRFSIGNSTHPGYLIHTEDVALAVVRALEQWPPCGLPATGGMPALPACRPLVLLSRAPNAVSGTPDAVSGTSRAVPRILRLSESSAAGHVSALFSGTLWDCTLIAH
jgi:hypothetical protein